MSVTPPRGRTVFDPDADARKRAFLASDFLHALLAKYTLTGYSKVYLLASLTLILMSHSHKQGGGNAQGSGGGTGRRKSEEVYLLYTSRN